MLDGIGAAAAALVAATAASDFARAIMTTDRGPKRCTLRSRGVTLSAQAKGAGMIEPGFATMLCFVQTDAVVERPRGDAAPGGRRLVRADHGRRPDEHQRHRRAPGDAAPAGGPLPDGLLDAVLLQLALEVVADGEGRDPGRAGRGPEAASAAEAERVARAIANSPLVKTALHGRDPNWGRIAQAAGMALAGEELPELGPGRIDAAELGGRRAEAEIAVRLGRGERCARTSTSAT